MWMDAPWADAYSLQRSLMHLIHGSCSQGIEERRARISAIFHVVRAYGTLLHHRTVVQMGHNLGQDGLGLVPAILRQT